MWIEVNMFWDIFSFLFFFWACNVSSISPQTSYTFSFSLFKLDYMKLATQLWRFLWFDFKQSYFHSGWKSSKISLPHRSCSAMWENLQRKCTQVWFFSCRMCTYVLLHCISISIHSGQFSLISWGNIQTID